MSQGQISQAEGGVRTAPVQTRADKRTRLEDVAALVRDGDTVAVGGGLSSREPMAILRALVRRKARNLRVVGSAHGIDIDLLCGAGAVSCSSESYVGFEQDFGIAPNYRRACEAGEVRVDDSCCYTVVQQLRAAVLGLPFMPIRSARGTDFPGLHPEYKTMTCPYTGEELLLVPALAPDVAILHAQYGDAQGNLRIEGPPVLDLLFAKASRLVVASVEEIVSTERLVELGGVTIPYFYVAALAEAPKGAHPTACYPFYAYDRPHTARYYAAARGGAERFAADYLQPFVHDCSDLASYRERVGGDSTFRRLASWEGGKESWISLYGEELAQ
jgi:glutaconate CoA-transferase, subunit A